MESGKERERKVTSEGGDAPDSGGEKRKKGRSVYMPLVILCAVLLAAGAGLFGFGASRYFPSRQRVRGYDSTEGRVVTYEEKVTLDSESHRSYLLYAEVVEYTVDGTSYRARSDAFTNHPKERGEAVTVWYDPASPGSAVLDLLQKDIAVMLGGLAFLLGGAFFLIILCGAGNPVAHKAGFCVLGALACCFGLLAVLSELAGDAPTARALFASGPMMYVGLILLLAGAAIFVVSAVGIVKLCRKRRGRGAGA